MEGSAKNGWKARGDCLEWREYRTDAVLTGNARRNTRSVDGPHSVARGVRHSDLIDYQPTGGKGRGVRSFRAKVACPAAPNFTRPSGSGTARGETSTRVMPWRWLKPISRAVDGDRSTIRPPT